MNWPKELYDVFLMGLKVDPIEGLTQADVLKTLFDETARRAVWRARGNPAHAAGALRTPYTPMGAVIAEGILGQARSVSIHGAEWGDAMHALYDYIEANAEEVFAAFADQPRPYHSGNLFSEGGPDE